MRPFSRSEAKRLVQDLLTPKPLLYWIDFLITVSIGYGCAAMYLTAPAFSPMQIAAFLLAGPALFRAGIFIHEIVHREEPSMAGFRLAWNLCDRASGSLASFRYHVVPLAGSRRSAEL